MTEDVLHNQLTAEWFLFFNILPLYPSLQAKVKGVFYVRFDWQPSVQKWMAHTMRFGGQFRLLAPPVMDKVLNDALMLGLPLFIQSNKTGQIKQFTKIQ